MRAAHKMHMIEEFSIKKKMALKISPLVGRESERVHVHNYMPQLVASYFCNSSNALPADWAFTNLLLRRA